MCRCLRKPFESTYSQALQSYYTNKFYRRCYGKQAYRRRDWTTLSLSFCKMAKTPKQHKEGIKSWILHMSCSPRSCVIGVSFQGCQAGFHLPASVSPAVTHTVPCSTFCLLCQLGRSRVKLVGLVIFFIRVSLCCNSAVLWQKTLTGFAWTPPVPCVLEGLLALVSQGNRCLSIDTVTAVYCGNKWLRRRL